MTVVVFSALVVLFDDKSDAAVLDLQVLVDARARVAEQLVGGVHNAAVLAVAQHLDEVGVRLVVAVVDPVGGRPVAAAVAHVVPDAAVIGVLDFDGLAGRAHEAPRAELAHELGHRFCWPIENRRVSISLFQFFLFFHSIQTGTGHFTVNYSALNNQIATDDIIK